MGTQRSRRIARTRRPLLEKFREVVCNAARGHPALAGGGENKFEDVARARMTCIRIVEVLPTPADLFHAAAEEFVRLGRAAIAEHGRFTVALSGGSTPRSLYSLLAKDHADFAWNQTFLFFGDERHVPPGHPESNYRMVKESLLTKVPIPNGNVFRVQAEMPDPAAAAADYEQQLRNFFALRPGEFPSF